MLSHHDKLASRVTAVTYVWCGSFLFIIYTQEIEKVKNYKIVLGVLIISTHSRHFIYARKKVKTSKFHVPMYLAFVTWR